MKEIWLSVPEAAQVTGESERTVQWKAQTKVYESELKESEFGGGSAGKSLRILLTSLPPSAQVLALRELGLILPDEGGAWLQASEAKREAALARFKILASLENYIRISSKRRTAARQEFCHVWNEKHPDQKISERTLRNWEQARNHFGRVGLLPDYGKRAQKNLISPEAWDYFRQIYLQQSKRSVTDCYRDLLTLAGEYDWRIPSLRRVQQMAAEIPEAVVVLQREGKDAFMNTCQSSSKRTWDNEPANKCWMGDHHRLDFFVKTPNGRGHTRPWLTAWMDARSWKIVGWQLCWTPSGDSILASFRQGALDPTIGLPGMIYIDNGRDYASKEFAGTGHRTRKSTQGDLRVQTTLETLGVGVTFAIPGNARAKTIERFFGTLSRQFSKRFDTYCGSDNQERPERLEAILKSGMVPTMEEVQEKLTAYMTLYNKTVSQGEGREGKSPDQIFAETRGAIRTAPASTLKLCLMRHSQPIKVRMNGLEFMKHQYNNPELIRHRGEKVYIRYDDHDMTEVEVFNLKDEWLMSAKLVTALPALGATKEQIAAANSARKRELEIAKEMGNIGIVINPLSPLDQLRIQSERIAEKVANPERPKVMEIVNIPQVMRKAVGQMVDHPMKIPESMLKRPEPSGKNIDIMKILSKRKGD